MANDQTIEQLQARIAELEQQSRLWFDGTKWVELDSPDDVKERREVCGRAAVSHAELICGLIAERDAAREQVNALREALERYGWCHPDCPASPSATGTEHEGACECGYIAALAQQDTNTGEQP